MIYPRTGHLWESRLLVRVASITLGLVLSTLYFVSWTGDELGFCMLGSCK